MIGLGMAQGWMADLSRVATGGLVSAVWQGMLLAIVVALGLRLLPKTPAAVRFAIWFAVFFVVTALPVASFWHHGAGSAQGVGRGAWLTLDARWSLAIAAVWVIASFVRAGTLVMAAVRVRTLWKRARPVEMGASGLDSTLHDVAVKDGVQGVLSGTRGAQICTSDEVDRPTVIGFFVPKILIPTWLLEKLTAAELEQIVLHEAGHLRRADDWMNLLQKVALVVFPLNPALAWVERRLCFERELACDERVLLATQAPKAYASCLATLAEHRLGRRGLALALGALGRESELARRVGRILRRGEPMRPAHARLVLGGAMLGLLGGAVGLARCPQMIGFTSSSEQSAAAVVALGSAQAVLSGGFEAVAINTDSSRFVNSDLGNKRNVPHEVLLKASAESSVGAGETGPQRLKPRVESEGYGTAEAVPLTKTDVVVRQTSMIGKTDLVLMRRAGRIEQSKAHIVETRYSGAEQRNKQPGQVADRAVEWVVVTSWQGEDGSRLVLTTATGSNVRENVIRQPVVNNDDTEPSSGEIYPYAAVPVQGGWLVVQL